MDKFSWDGRKPEAVLAFLYTIQISIMHLKHKSKLLCESFEKYHHHHHHHHHIIYQEKLTLARSLTHSLTHSLSHQTIPSPT